MASIYIFRNTIFILAKSISALSHYGPHSYPISIAPDIVLLKISIKRTALSDRFSASFKNILFLLLSYLYIYRRRLTIRFISTWPHGFCNTFICVPLGKYKFTICCSYLKSKIQANKIINIFIIMLHYRTLLSDNGNNSNNVFDNRLQ